MCNLSEGLLEEGRAEGRNEGIAIVELNRAEKTTLSMLKDSEPVSKIIRYSDLLREQIEKLSVDNGYNLVEE